jgi:hypothetical protein
MCSACGESGAILVWRRLQSPVRKRRVVVRVDDGGGPLPGALGAGAVTCAGY